MPEPEPMTSGEKRGCLCLIYALMSYPLNWLFLTYVFVPLGKSGWLGPKLDSRGFEL